MPTSTSEFAAINQTAAFSRKEPWSPKTGATPSPPSPFTYSPEESRAGDLFAPWRIRVAHPVWLGLSPRPGAPSGRGAEPPTGDPHLDDFSSLRTYRNFADRRRNTPACRYFRFLRDDGCSRRLKVDFFDFFSFSDMRRLNVSNLDVSKVFRG